MDYFALKKLLFDSADNKNMEFAEKVFNTSYKIIGLMTPTLKRIINEHYKDEDLKLSDFELEARYNSIVRSVRNKWRNESQKYFERLHNMKEKNEENYNKKMTSLQKALNDKDNKIKNKIKENNSIKEEERKHSHDVFSQKEKRARDTYNRKLQMDEEERTENERKLLNHSK